MNDVNFRNLNRVSPCWPITSNGSRTVRGTKIDRPHGVALAQEEEHVLRCLGAALILQWNTLPRKLRRELFDNAGSMGELLETAELRAKIARFLNKQNDDEEAGT
jgi:hypothetical protein